MKIITLLALIVLIALPASAQDPKIYTNEDLGRYDRGPTSSGNYGGRIDVEAIREEMKRNDEKRISDSLERERTEQAFWADIEQYKVSNATVDELRKVHTAVIAHYSARLKDPESLRIYDFDVVKRGPFFVVTLNYGAKNSFGAYVRDSGKLVFKGDELIRWAK
jgi:hypothetical protein